MIYRISVHGCDDSTHVTRELTDEEAALLQDVAKQITEASVYQCMPTMLVQPAGDNHPENL